MVFEVRGEADYTLPVGQLSPRLANLLLRPP